ncbi:Inner membrane protein OxaA [Herminiimonas arsenicoxydans]|uniref:Membrane protein insertase YidC n=1 Tax=Herminiimonas arsenicoxydans TaxID=204773 RepID=YIDC_HERAR|nr:RecName: Full=Membrane protein insertase YidC; AltName: Full=Foldase YidC; AltName: Full=Membrane integrase YidC; AltName: Full=Membrane protein YidC [Herminiimonas arsenicoxydans]CAL63570.1 Inner membrane protein OxaA [Herminiimonas arsenicoxydans]
MDIKRTVLWVIFSFSLLMLWDNYNRYTGKPSIFFDSTTTQQAAAPAATGNNAAKTADAPTAATTAATSGANTPGVPDGAAAVKSEVITITTDLMKIGIDTAGGEVRHLELLKHHESGDESKNVVLFDENGQHTYLGQTGLIGGAYPNHKSMFAAVPGPRTLDSANQVQLVLQSEQQGVKLIKTFTFKRGEYKVDIKHDVVNNTSTAITPSLYLQLVHDGSALGGGSMFMASAFTGPAIYTEADKFQKVTFESIEKGKAEHAMKGESGWIALVQHYFVSAFVPPANTPREYFTKKLATNLYAVGTILPMGTVAPGATASMDTTMYSGPQESKRLEAVAPGFELVKDYGWLTIIAKPIFWLMMQIHQILGNWGWTIIVLTIVIKLAFFPLSAAGYRSMAKMKLVTPKMTDIRTRYKGEPQKMNAAMMELYKKEKINPIGGCFPMLVQIPVFISLYWVLLASVEIRNASWLWIHDLAAPDILFGSYHIGTFHLTIGILPILMAISMFIQTKLNPTPPDPIQAKVMMFMPIAFSVMFFFFPAGLVLYWVVNNILSIAQQWFINEKLLGGKAKA